MTLRIIVVLLFPICTLSAQKLPLFDNEERMNMVVDGGYFIYNNEFEKADSMILEVQKILPGHPIVYLMQALNIAWQEMPIRTTSSVFQAHYEKLQQVIEASELLQEVADDHQEGIFFEMAARGLLTEYYAREGTYLKALGEARKMYSLTKKGFDFVDDNPEFLFSTGLYNYFREMYPNRHPIYKPFMWFFKSGGIDIGLEQLDKATRVGRLTKIEAHLYLSYIYLRYENDPQMARKYLDKLVNDYPNNSYFKSKLLECLVFKNNYQDALPIIDQLINNEDPYYRMCAEVYTGVYYEKNQSKQNLAEEYYLKAINSGAHYTNKALYYKSLAFIGLGRINESNNNLVTAEKYYRRVIDLNENDELTKEARKRVKGL